MWAEGSQDIGFIVESLHECQPFDRPQRNEHFHGLNNQEQSSRSWNKHTKEAGTLLCAFGRASELFDFSDSKKFKSSNYRINKVLRNNVIRTIKNMNNLLEIKEHNGIILAVKVVPLCKPR